MQSEQATATLVVSTVELDSPQVEIRGPAYRHLFRARRLGVGESVRLVDGEGRARWSQVLRVDRQCGVLEVQGEAPSNRPAVHLEIAVAAPAPERSSWLVEKLTEMGVAAIRFFNCSRSPRTYGTRTFERLRRIAVAAVEQSHRSQVPEVSGTYSWSQIKELAEGRPAWFLHPRAQSVWPPGGPSPALLLVGPEGGWTEEECQELGDLGCKAVSLGPGVLRVETAALVGGALVLYPREPHREGKTSAP